MSQVFDNVYSTIVLTSTVGGRKIYKGQVLKWESVLVSFGDYWCQFPLLYSTIVSCFFFADHNTAQVSHLGSWAKPGVDISYSKVFIGSMGF